MNSSQGIRRVRSASLATAVVAALAAAATARAQGTDCAAAEARVAGRAPPVCAPPSALSPAQELACAEHQRWASIAADCRRAAERDDRRRLTKYPSESVHRKAEVDEIATVVVKLRAPNARLAELLAQHTVLAQKAEFYPKGVPLELRREIEANDAALLAVRDVFRVIEGEIAGVVDKYDDERGHLRKLWGGAPPGSIGVFVPRSATTSSSLAPAAPQNRT
jgi:hypothetical protein